MSVVKADYYELLGVPENADEEMIREAFHAAARDCRPDLSDSLDAESQFRDLAEAYSVLSEPAARLLYDRFGYRGRGNRRFEEALGLVREAATGIAREEPVGVARAPAAQGESIRAEVELQAFEAREGASRTIRYETARTCVRCEKRGLTMEPDPDCPRCGGTGRERVERRLRIRVPAGMEDGAQLRVGGEGDVGERGGPPGDLLLDVSVLPPPRDFRLVRYLALALFLSAVGLLVVYLLLR